ncbi:MAG TPA: putative Ig domain-containing protein [Steroidobacteraceae bacterium]|nr:putative Ig domain-containing protein [Steroidobacteraceae bacterium]
MQLAAMPECLTRFGSHIAALNRSRRFLLALLMVAPLASQAVTEQLYIGGTPAKTAPAGAAYSFRPWVAGTNTSHLSFRVFNKPSWATFSTKSGLLYGKTTAGTYNRVAIAVSDGIKTVYMPQWTITVAAAGSAPPPPTNPPPTNPPPAPDVPKISGSPATSDTVGTAYSFQPTASDPLGAKLTFAISNKPAWAAFSTTTGQLSGTPGATNVGTVANIVISASNGKASASLPAFSLTVTGTSTSTGSVTLNWQPPTENTDGSALSNLAGYTIEYGTSPSSLTNTIKVTNPGLTQYVISDLAPGIWYFGMLSVNSSGVQSALSGVASKTIN